MKNVANCSYLIKKESKERVTIWYCIRGLPMNSIKSRRMQGFQSKVVMAKELFKLQK